MTTSEPIILPPAAADLLEYLLSIADELNPDNVTRADIVSVALHLYYLCLTDELAHEKAVDVWITAYRIWNERKNEKLH